LRSGEIVPPNWGAGSVSYQQPSFATKALQHYFAVMKVREALRLLQDDGWYLVATKGSHRQFKHPTKLGRVTVAGKPGDDLALGTLDSILKQASLEQ
jgi:predicted RNA binding protein YcfA (HicA-like mRNA interferase family)